MTTYLITGGAGFIGSNFILFKRKQGNTRIINLDLLTYAGNLMNLQSLEQDPDHIFVRGNIGDRLLIRNLLETIKPSAIINFAAESHVDRSIGSPGDFIQTNVVGTFHLLEEVRYYWIHLSNGEKDSFRYLHISTDEVYGSLDFTDAPFHEQSPYAPNSPYSASKASSDHLVRAYHHTYGLPTLTTNCSNNYGPRQFPEKLIPLIILNAANGRPLPIYGDGLNIRDWLYVEDHCTALERVLEQGVPGEVYNIGGGFEKTNLEVVRSICRLLDSLLPDSLYRPHESLITFVKDRPGHDRRYAIDSSKLRNELNWQPLESFDTGLRKTISWYLENAEWVRSVQSGAYRDWVIRHYGQELSEGLQASN